MLYFAYGSNMNKVQMSIRCPAAVPVGVGRLPDWDLKERTYADIVPAPGKIVHGVIWDITEKCLESLDWYEGVTGGLYYRRTIAVRLGETVVECITYIMCLVPARRRDDHHFSEGYRRGCLLGTRQFGAPAHILYQVPTHIKQTKKRSQ